MCVIERFENALGNGIGPHTDGREKRTEIVFDNGRTVFSHDYRVYDLREVQGSFKGGISGRTFEYVSVNFHGSSLLRDSAVSTVKL